jgi:hypothetical protein
MGKSEFGQNCPLIVFFQNVILTAKIHKDKDSSTRVAFCYIIYEVKECQQSFVSPEFRAKTELLVYL